MLGRKMIIGLIGFLFFGLQEYVVGQTTRGGKGMTYMATTYSRLEVQASWIDDNLELSPTQEQELQEHNEDLVQQIEEIKEMDVSWEDQLDEVEKLSKHRKQSMKKILSKEQYRKMQAKVKQEQLDYKRMIADKKEEMVKQGVKKKDLKEKLMTNNQGRLRDEAINSTLGLF
ncbi:hypothetical protein V6R21_20510 [Limibacter armeniacum]|uniref:hypothetical protein n=1 Tax=Limibacter armeniacum TaxID=466084 RepID=UPI002FE644D6